MTRFPVFALRSAAARSVLCFWQGRPTAIPLDTSHGRLFFFVRYPREAEPEGSRYRLTNRAHVYPLHQEPNGRESALGG